MSQGCFQSKRTLDSERRPGEMGLVPEEPSWQVPCQGRPPAPGTRAGGAGDRRADPGPTLRSRLRSRPANDCG